MRKLLVTCLLLALILGLSVFARGASAAKPRSGSAIGPVAKIESDLLDWQICWMIYWYREPFSHDGGIHYRGAPRGNPPPATRESTNRRGK